MEKMIYINKLRSSVTTHFRKLVSVYFTGHMEYAFSFSVFSNSKLLFILREYLKLRITVTCRFKRPFLCHGLHIYFEIHAASFQVHGCVFMQRTCMQAITHKHISEFWCWNSTLNSEWNGAQVQGSLAHVQTSFL